MLLLLIEKIICRAFFLFFVFCSVLPVTGAPSLKPKQTWAVVIGISNYQNIPGLNYADKDAGAFYNYLVNVDGGPRLTRQHVKLLLNNNATSSAIYGALEWLKQSASENDRVIFYFSGHGDTEKGLTNEPAFLLAYNSPLAAYSAFGAINIDYLQKYIDVLVADRKVSDVILIADACRSGKLADGNEGTKHTIQSLGRKNNGRVVKILSAQENELSYEGRNWSNGMGVFSYFLVKGLEGLADANKDGVVTAGELSFFLEGMIGKATQYVQNPRVTGSQNHALFAINHKTLAAAKMNRIPVRFMMNNKLGEVMTTQLPENVRSDYDHYRYYLDQGRLLWGENKTDTINCARYYFFRLTGNQNAAGILPSVNSSFLSALSEKAEVLLQNYFKSPAHRQNYNDAITEMLYAKKLVTPDYILHDDLMAHIYYLESLNTTNSRTAISLLMQTLGLQENAPYALAELSYNYYHLHMTDSVLYYSNKALAALPNWAIPYYDLGTMYSDNSAYSKAKFYLEKAVKLDPGNADAWANLGTVYYYQKNYSQAMVYYNKAIKLDTNQYRAYDNMGDAYRNQGNYPEAIIYYKKSIKANPAYAKPYNNLGLIYQEQEHDTSKAILNYRKAIQLDPDYAIPYSNLGMIYFGLGNCGEAGRLFKKATILDTTQADYYSNFGIACTCLQKYQEGIAAFKKAQKLAPADPDIDMDMVAVYSILNEIPKSLSYLKSALQKGYRAYDAIIADGNLLNLRKDPEFHDLMRQYFPDKTNK